MRLIVGERMLPRMHVLPQVLANPSRVINALEVVKGRQLLLNEEPAILDTGLDQQRPWRDQPGNVWDVKVLVDVGYCLVT
ncbi:MAG: hypothetical protein ABFE08_16445 [Armatimonadia bacterium]